MNTPAQTTSFSFLLICQTYPPVIGGSEIEAQRVCSELIRRGHQATVVCAGGDPMPPLKYWIDPQGVPVRIYAARWKARLRDVVFALRVAQMMICERRSYQLVYFLMQGLHVAAGLPVARLLRKPVLMKDALTAVTQVFDKRNLLRGKPTSRVEKHSVQDNLANLAAEFAKFANAKTIQGEVIAEDIGEISGPTPSEGDAEVASICHSDQDTSEGGGLETGFSGADQEGSSTGQHDPSPAVQ